MKVKLVHSTSPWQAVYNAKVTHGKGLIMVSESFDNPDDSLKKLCEHLLKSEHFSVFRQNTYMFYIQELPRYVLQQLARHKFVELLVESTRYHFGQLVREWRELTPKAKESWLMQHFEILDNSDLELLAKIMDHIARFHLDKQIPIDQLKHLIPEGLYTNLTMTTNATQLMHMFRVRLAPDAHPRFRELMIQIKHVLREKYPTFWYLVFKTLYPEYVSL